MENFNWDLVRAWLLDQGLTIVVILVVSFIAYRLLGVATRRLSKHIQAMDGVDDSELDRRTKTIFRVVHSSGVVVIISTAVITILNEVGIPIGPLLASVGVVGLALGLGAQTLVKDVISGLFILIENQYTVNDVIEVSGIVGTVEEMNLRVTKVRDINGTIHIVPNGEIRVVANRTRDWSRAIVDVRISYEADVDRAVATLQAIGEKIQTADEVAALLLEAPTVTGVEGLEDWSLRLRLMVKTEPNEHWGVMRWLRKEIHEEFDRQGIALAHPRQDVVLMQVNGQFDQEEPTERKEETA